MPINEQEKELNAVEEQTLRQEAMDEIFGAESKPVTQKEVIKSDEVPADVPTEPLTDPKADPDLDKDALFAEVQKRLSAIEALNQTVSSMSFRLKQAEQRIGGLNNRLAEFKESKIQTDVPKQDAPTKQQIESAAEDDTAWDSLKTSFPDWATAIDKRIKAKEDRYVTKDEIANFQKQFERKPESVKPNVQKDQNQIDPMDIRLLNITHPDWRQIKDSNEFDSWLRKQDVNILDKAQNSVIAEDAISVLNLFKKDQSQKNLGSNEIEALKLKRKERLKSSTTEKTNHQEMKPKADDELSPEEFRRKAASEIFGK